MRANRVNEKDDEFSEKSQQTKIIYFHLEMSLFNETYCRLVPPAIYNYDFVFIDMCFRYVFIDGVYFTRHIVVL
jgi:hypothetical protein